MVSARSSILTLRDRLLDNVLPPPAVAEIKLTGGVVPRRFENVAVLFCDLGGVYKLL